MSTLLPSPTRISGSTYADSGQYPKRILGTDPKRILGSSYAESGHRNEHQVWDHQEKSDHKHFLAQTAVTPAGGHSRVSKKKFFRKSSSKPGRSRQNALRWPDLSCYDLSDPIDIHNCHQLLAAIGGIRDDHAGLEHVALAAVMARRLADRNPHGYFARILRNGFTQFGPADKDFAAAKQILRELSEW